MRDEVQDEPVPVGSGEASVLGSGAEAVASPEAGDGAAFERLDPASVPAARLGSLIALVVLGVLAGSFLGAVPALGSDVDLDGLLVLRVAALGLWGLLAVRAWIWPALVYARTRYRLTDAALEIRRGVLLHVWHAVPRSRIQHTDVSSGPIQRRYGVATLQVHTAGTTNATVGLSGLSQRTAEALRDELMRGLVAREGDGV